MPVYFIVEIKEIFDKEKYMQYMSKVPAIVEKFNTWRHSPQYSTVAPLREQSAKTNAIVADGFWNKKHLLIIFINKPLLTNMFF